MSVMLKKTWMAIVVLVTLISNAQAIRNGGAAISSASSYC